MNPTTMLTDTATVVPTADVHLRLTRTFAAPPDRVFAAWTDPDQFTRWLAPRAMDSRCEAYDMDVRPGGRYAIRIGVRDGRTLTLSGTYRAVEPPSRLAFTWSWAHDPAETLVTVTLAPTEDGGTALTLTHEGLGTGDRRDRHAAGWPLSLDQLAELLSASAASAAVAAGT